MSLRSEIQALSGQNVNLCFQCSKCSSGCPLADKMDVKPAQLMHMVRLGMEEPVFNSRTIWLCLSCEACSSGCPQGVQPAAVMDAARVLALKRGVRPAVREVEIYYRGFVGNMRLNGRIHDASVVAVARLLSGHLLDDLPLAWMLLRRGRVKLPPLFPRGGRFRTLYRRTLARERQRERDASAKETKP